MVNRLFASIFLSSFFFLLSCGGKSDEIKHPAYNAELLQRIRAAAAAIPGSMPQSISYLKYAESIRKWSDIIEGGGDDPCKMARTAFQIDYPDGWVMVDAGMDRQIHRFFEKEKQQPFDQEKADMVRQAVENARLVLVTHEHGDHVGGAIRTANTGGVPRKTILTQEQVNALINNPQMPEIKLDENTSRQYIITSFESILPVSPGIVLIKAPGHTNGELMIYTRLQNGKEYIFTGDVSWSYKGVAEKKQKPKSEIKRIGESSEIVGQQLAWLHDLMNRERVTILVSHDDIMLPQFAAQGLIGNTIKTGMENR